MISNNIVGNCWSNIANDPYSSLDTGEFFKQLFLFDKIYLHSAGLKEVASIVAAIGTGQFIELLEEGIVEFIVDYPTFGVTGQSVGILERKKALPLGSHAFAAVKFHLSKKEIGKYLQNTYPAGHNISKREFQKLKRTVVSKIKDTQRVLKRISKPVVKTIT
jgi:hypothetical protein